MKRLTLVTMQLKTPGGIERFISTLATMFANDFKVEVVVNYGKPSEPLAFPLPKNVKLTFLTPKKPDEISMKSLITGFKWHRIPKEIIRRMNIKKTKNQVFKNYFTSLNTDYLITDRADYNRLIFKYYHGHAIKIATDHNYHQNNPKYINELISSLQGFDYLVVVTKELEDFYKAKIKPTKCLTIPNALVTIPTKKSPLNSPNLLAIGRLYPEKDFSTLIDTMKIIHDQNPDVHLTIIGDGPEYKALKSKIASQNLQKAITLTGFIPQPQISDYYYQSSLFVMTSITEAFGLVLIEAMSHGVPCVAFSRASGARNLITKDTGVLINHSTPETLAGSILDLLSHPDKLKQYQININSTINQYSLSEVKKLWQKILQ